MDTEKFDIERIKTFWLIEARYPNMKRAFRQKCTPEYTARQMSLIKEVFAWLHSQIP